MNHIARLVLVAITLCLFTACTNDEADRERARAQQEQQARQVAEKQRQAAESQREAAEKARQAAEENKSFWQTVAWVVGIATFGIFLYGIALGSSARKDAKARRPPDV